MDGFCVHQGESRMVDTFYVHQAESRLVDTNHVHQAEFGLLDGFHVQQGETRLHGFFQYVEFSVLEYCFPILSCTIGNEKFRNAFCPSFKHLWWVTDGQKEVLDLSFWEILLSLYLSYIVLRFDTLKPRYKENKNVLSYNLFIF